MKIEHIISEAFVPINDSKIEKLLRTKFSEAWQYYLKHSLALYRHDSGSPRDDEVTIASPLKERQAAYALSNLHNEYINNDNKWMSFPPRSVIASTSHDRADGRGTPDEIFMILPVNGASIGICPQHDIWASFEEIHKLMNTDSEKQILNDFYRELFVITEAIEKHLDVEISSWIKGSGASYDTYRDELNTIDNLIDELTINQHEEETVEYYSLDADSIQESVQIVRCLLGYEYEFVSGRLLNICIAMQENGFSYTLDNIFSPKNFDVGSIGNILTNNTQDNEVWFDSTYMMIPVNYLETFIKKYKDIK